MSVAIREWMAVNGITMEQLYAAWQERDDARAKLAASQAHAAKLRAALTGLVSDVELYMDADAAALLSALAALAATPEHALALAAAAALGVEVPYVQPCSTERLSQRDDAPIVNAAEGR